MPLLIAVAASVRVVGHGGSASAAQTPHAPGLPQAQASSAVGLSNVGDPPSASDRESDRFQCDRECRWKYGFFDRTIIGENANGRWIADNQRCRCYRLINETAAELLDNGDEVPKWTKRDFDSETTWSGDFSCQFVCADTADGLKTMTKDEAQASPDVREIVHCGVCAACSAPEDVVVLPLTRKWITKEMTDVSGGFAAPWGHGDVSRLREELTNRGMNFSTARPDGRTDQPTCMDCWTDNIMCTRNSCLDVCWIKIFDPENPPADIDNCGVFDFACKCLKCDEEYCGPAFIKCAGANRRSTGILSDIPRPEEQQCKVGKYHGVPDSELPTLPDPNP